MGNSIKSNKIRGVMVAIIFLSIAAVSILGYPYARERLVQYSISYYNYEPRQPVQVEVDVSSLPPAKAVPIIMYHGIVRERDEVNTTHKNFIEQMEMLKREGYETITLDDYYNFRQGTFVLPPKPIIITFDDGRKDSYYPTDDIFKKLGFKATIFVASARALADDPFYLSWDELKMMKDSGRWDIQAHGRRSHDILPLSPDSKDGGRFLVSRQYLADEKRLETIEEFEKRVEQDYVDNISDLQAYLGIKPNYLAIPLEDYGVRDGSNYPEGRDFNGEVTRKYFKLAFIQSNDSADAVRINLPIYNYANDDPYTIRRIEVVNLDANTLKNMLESEVPARPDLRLTAADVPSFQNHSFLSYGQATFGDYGLALSPGENEDDKSAFITFGDRHWSNYSVSASIYRDSGRSVVLVLYRWDKDNYVSFGMTDKGIFLRETIDKVERTLAPSYLYNGPRNLEDKHLFQASIKDGRLTASLDGVTIYRNIPVTLTEGAVGFKVWSDRGRALGTLKLLEVKSLDEPVEIVSTSTPKIITGRR